MNTMKNLRPEKSAGEAMVVGGFGVRWIPPGKFAMGSPKGEPNLELYDIDYEVQHTVTITRGFWMSDHQVTQGEYQDVMGSNPSHFSGSTSLPVESVCWDEASEFCGKLTEKHHAEGIISEGLGWRLPTEAEWEYAARAGTKRARYGKLERIAWYEGNSDGHTHPVKQKAPNAWGLHDMLGNVEEWCSDFLGKYSARAVKDPKGAKYTPGDFHVTRGGSWDSSGQLARAASRFRLCPREGGPAIGFRPVFCTIG